MAYNNLRFFDSDSNDLNLVFNTDLDLWQGVAYLPLVSTGLYETLTLHILENVEGQLLEDLHVTPIAEAVGDVSFKFRFSNDYNTSEYIFLYSAKSNAGEILVQKDLEQSSTLLDNSIAVDYNTVTDKKIVTANLKADPIMVRAALNSEVEGFHIRPLSIIEVVDGVETREIARIKVYGEVEGEDERLRTLLTNIGMNLDDLDYFIFKDSNINEQSPDHILLNQKRKELLLQASQIKPFIGTYKALLNAVDFFGYDKITLKEYWLNIDEQSENFGKLKAVAVPNQDVIGFLADKNKTTDLPNSNQKKTSRFSLVYRLNTPTGQQDEWDMPIVEETLDYSPDEVLIKLYGLKKKLQKDYLPLQAKIVDITGEGDYFSQFNQNVWNNQHNIKAQDAGREYTVEKVPALRDVFMEDLRLVDYRLTGFNQDFEALQGIYEQTNIGFTNFPAIISGHSNNILTITGEDLSKECTLDFSYLESAIPGSYVEILNVSFDGYNTIIKTSDAISTSYTQIGTSYIAIYSNTSKIILDSIETFYTEYYDNKLDTFNTMDGIPIGAPISLHIEKGLEDSWDFANFTWEDAGDEYSGKGVYNFFEDYPVDVPVYGPNPAYPGIVPGTENNNVPTPEPVNILVGYISQYTNFKTLEDNGNKLLNWEDWWHRGIYEIEWKLIGPNGYNRSFRGPVYEYNHFPLTLPYVGSYTVEAHAHDLYNVTSTRIQKDWIEVKNKNVEVYGLTQLAPKKLDWQEYVYSWDKSGSSWDWSRENTLPVSDTISTYYLTMDRANYIQDPEENGLEFSTVRRYQDATQPNGFNETAGPYQWSALDNHVWDDGPEVTWKMTRIGSDINSSFQIWAVPGNQWINIKQKDPGTGVISRDSYQIVNIIPPTSFAISQWQLIADELNSLDSNEHPILSKFNFNPVYNDIDSNGTDDQLLYILAVAKEPARTYDFNEVWMSQIENWSPNTSTVREKINFVSYNPGFDDTYIINGLVDLHKLNHVTFSYDLTNMPGIVSQNWKVTNNTLNIDDIYYNNQVLTHLFKHKGYYTVELEIRDSNGNKNTITKNILNII
jgi:hypothetical protein